MIYKEARLNVVGTYIGGKGIRKVASEGEFGISEAKFSEVLSEVADLYKISRKPGDFVFAAVRAVTADVPNENKDCFGEYELLSVKGDGRFTYETFNGVPLFQEHQDGDITQSGGLVIDACYDDTIVTDRKVMGLIGVDMTKRRKLASGLLNGVVQSFSMGCVCEQTRCSICGNVATNPIRFCNHIRNKAFINTVAGKSVFEWCEGVTYRELSHVANPADPKALSVEVLI